MYLLVALLLFSATTVMAGRKSYSSHRQNHEFSLADLSKCRINDMTIEMDDTDIYMTHDEFIEDEVMLNEKHELFVNDEKIVLNEDQLALVSEFYDTVFDIKDEAKKIGWEGAKLGIDGAKIGLKAIGGVLKMIFTSYDEDDLERDMEAATDKIELKANRLEKKAEVIEEMAYDIEDMSFEMFETIPALEELGWF